MTSPLLQIRDQGESHIRYVIRGGYDLLILLGEVVQEIAEYEYELESLIGKPPSTPAEASA